VNKSEVLQRSLLHALGFLQRTLAAPESEIQRAAAIQGFEFTYELSWKLLQERLREEGVDVATPRATFRSAGDAGLIDDVSAWLGYLNARNLTSHTYNEGTANEVYAVVKGSFADDVATLVRPH
jgi:nucleotidyltransferase substrate binding protein (TIGR01987 family)